MLYASFGHFTACWTTNFKLFTGKGCKNFPGLGICSIKSYESEYVREFQNFYKGRYWLTNAPDVGENKYFEAVIVVRHWDGMLCADFVNINSENCKFDEINEWNVDILQGVQIERRRNQQQIRYFFRLTIEDFSRPTEVQDMGECSKYSRQRKTGHAAAQKRADEHLLRSQLQNCYFLKFSRFRKIQWSLFTTLRSQHFGRSKCIISCNEAAL